MINGEKKNNPYRRDTLRVLCGIRPETQQKRTTQFEAHWNHRERETFQEEAGKKNISLAKGVMKATGGITKSETGKKKKLT